METKQFKAQSKRLLEMMINSIYAHKEIFLRELISNASDAIDKLYFKSLTDDKVGMNKSDFAIWLEPDKDKKTLTISDNGIGIRPEDLPRIFEKGFTGFNGREDKKSTGIGLFLCKKILTKLSHTITVTSEVGKGTAVKLCLDTVSLGVE